MSRYRSSHRHLSTTALLVALAASGALPLASAGCSGDAASAPTAGEAGGSGGSGGSSASQGGDGGSGGLGFDMPDLASIAIEPPSAILTSTNGEKPEQAFRVIGIFNDGVRQELSGATFSIEPLSLGGIDQSTGVFKASGIIGGTAAVRAELSTSAGPLTAEATVTVKLDYVLYGEGAPTDADTHFAGALTDDATRAAGVVYPLNHALMPQNVYPADVQWLNGAPGDIFRITLQKPNVTARAYVLHAGAAFKNDWVVDTAAWRSLAQTDPDDPMAITVDRWESSSGETIASGAPVTMTFAKAALTGSVYYWDILAGRIKRIDDGAGTAVSFMPTPPASPASGERCVGCHSVSGSGRYMAGRLGGGDNIGAIFDLTQDLTVNPAPTVYPLNNTSKRWWFSSWSPDETRMVVSVEEVNSSVRAMKIYDPFTGQEVAVQGKLPRNITQPVWSPDGNTIAYVSQVNNWGGAFTVGNISLLPVTGPDAFGTPQVIHEGSSLEGGVPGGGSDSYPTWSPDSKLLAFAHGTGSRSDSPDGRQSALYLMNADGTNVVRLDTACGGPTSTDDFQPRFAPFDSGGYFWLSFLSRRSYGNAQAGTRDTQRQQIWIAGIKKDVAPGEDPSAVAFWLPGQATGSKNISAYWAPRACRVDGESCSVGSECCGGDCRPDEDGALVCTPPPPDRCRGYNETCTTSADCCDQRECVNNVCIDPLPR